MSLSNELSCEAGSFYLHHNPHRFSVRGFKILFPQHWNPGLHSLSHSLVVPPGLSPWKCGTTCSASSRPSWSSSSCLASLVCLLSPCLTSSPPLLPVRMNVSSLTSWLSGFHTVHFSGSSVFFCF